MADAVPPTDDVTYVEYGPQSLQPTKFSEDGKSYDTYGYYQIKTGYETASGILQVPVAGPAGVNALPAKIIRLHSPMTRKIIEWTAERVGQMPIMPHWDTQQPNEVLAHREVFSFNPQIQVGGEHYKYLMQGRYVYFLQAPPADGSQPTATVPMVVDPCDVFTVYEYLFSKELIRSLPPNGTATIKQFV